MVADISIFTDFLGLVNAPGTKQDTDPLGPPQARFKDADNNTIDLLNPIPIPTAGTRFSRWKHMYMKATTAPDTQIDNVKIYTDGGGFGVGITVRIGDGVQANTLLADAGYDVSDVANEDMVNHDTVATKTDFFTFTVGAPRSIGISEAGAIIDTINEESDYAVLQMEVLSTASPGDLPDETITFEYDEI